MPLTTVSPGLLDSNAQYYGFKNRIINGAMVIDQRNAGASVTPTDGQYTLDRWFASLSQASKFTIQQNAGAVTPPAGFNNYLGITVGASANVTVGAGDYFSIAQYIEGFNVADLGFGAAGASTVTLSFWVRSSLTGTFGGSLRNSAANRNYPFSYTISAANTWEQKTITIPGDTTGTWLKTNGLGLALFLAIGVGSTFTDTAGAWTTKSSVISATGATNLISTNGATFYLTGVQLEKGSTATSFDYRPYGTELALCQRYFWKNVDPGANGVVANNGDSVSRFTFYSPVTMRATPTASASGAFNFWNGAATFTSSTVTGVFPTTYGDFQLDFGTLSANAGATGRAVAVYTSAAAFFVSASAEL
jgi:hypothetical protein